MLAFAIYIGYKYLTMAETTQTPTTDIGNFLKSMIEVGGRGSMTNLSKESGVSMQGLRNWIQGKTKVTGGYRTALEAAFGLPFEEMERLGRQPGTPVEFNGRETLTSDEPVKNEADNAKEGTSLDVDKAKVLGSMITRLAKGPAMSETDFAAVKYLLEL